MKYKIDFAPENTTRDIIKPGAYAIYYKKHWYNKWKILDGMRFADIKIAKSVALEYAQLPMYVN